MKEESPNQFTDTIDLLNYGFNNFEVVNVLEKFPGNYGQVIGRGIMVVVMEAVGIGKMGVQAAKFRSTTKILTCLIATENSSLDEIVSFSFFS